jgi:hypothetical protein
MTQEEFTSILGDDWQVGKGKVDWFSFELGKVSKEYVESHTWYNALTRGLKPSKALETWSGLHPCHQER